MPVLEVFRVAIFEVARNPNASRLTTYLTVALPGAFPGIFTGLKICLGTALILLVAVEFSTADSGVGFLVISLLGLLFSYAVDSCERLLVPWRQTFR
ncbi:ABC transporter permease subunit [Neorhizobium galegae]|uniref:ABC transmembrane type-1 domain-containing protein n=1 Tax=Neorhizobium galegae bv. orientalis str. HAMBI 540 TaxID=1028800 RepID=A0A068SYJ6_NEOGA|nr:Hypothetical protein RG540_PA02310 [Neorhizobium galegae bv. orientalis str. HAMBI 540]CDZ43802.1 Hypothetical protein NGAL_HAMBI2427_04160 [Neorhizobium galegae bv. orientalis]